MDVGQEGKCVKVPVGAGVIDLITTGLYEDPLTLYREYIQNVGDAVEVLPDEQLRRTYIQISIDVARRSVVIRDNGPGIPYEEALHSLVALGISSKRSGSQRGFRGVGRLVGLSFSEVVQFRTKSVNSNIVTKISWDARQLSQILAQLRSSRAALGDSSLRACINITREFSDDSASSFFEVALEGIRRHVASSVLNIDSVADYIGEVCPVPFSESFPFIDQIRERRNEFQSLLELDIRINGRELPITKPHGRRVHLSVNRNSKFRKFELFRVPSLVRGEVSAVGWVAHSGYAGAILKRDRVRGLRLRCGNIQIGQEKTLDHIFKERRFNRWCVGEIHILDANLIPNGRRDYFEPSPHLRNLENHLSLIAERISKRCRMASRLRNECKRYQSKLDRVEFVGRLIRHGYFSTSVGQEIWKQSRRTLEAMRQSLSDRNIDDSIHSRVLKLLELDLGDVGLDDVRHYAGIPSAEVDALQKVFRVLVQIVPSTDVSRKVIESVLKSAELTSEE